MKKALLLLLIGFMAIAPMTASASVRTEGMGVTPQQVDDLDLIWLFPQKIDEYSLVDYRLESMNGEEWGGIIHKDPYIGNWGLYIGRPFNNAPTINITQHAYIASLFGSIVDGMGTWDTRLHAHVSNTIVDTITTGLNDPENKLDIFKSFAVGNGVLGVRVNYASLKTTDTENSNNTTSTPVDHSGTTDDTLNRQGVIGVDVGYGMKDLGPFNALDLGLGYWMGSVDDKAVTNQLNPAGTGYVPDTVNETKGDGINEIAFNARAVKEASENTNLVTNLAFRTSKLALKGTVTTTNADGTLSNAANAQGSGTVEHKNTFISLGVNCDHKVNGGTGLVVGGLNFQYAKGTWTNDARTNAVGSTVADRLVDVGGDEFEQKYMGAWANVGVEANLKSWLQIRGGFSHELIGTVSSVETLNVDTSLLNNAFQDTTETKTSVDTAEETELTFGVGLNYKNWNVDLLTSLNDVENLLEAPNVGQGILYDGQLMGLNFARAQVKYNF